MENDERNGKQCVICLLYTSYFLLMVQYLVPGLVLAWAYDHTGTLWSSILLHAAANALSVWASI